MQTILLVEDDYELNESITYMLRQERYEVSSAYSIKEARDRYHEQEPDLILLDVNLPDGEGFTFCKWVKEKKDVPVLFLTARDLEEDALLGYELGAEDYVTKPFSMKILLKKIRVMLKLVSEEADNVFDDGYLRADLSKAKVEVNGKPCSLTPTEFKLLQVFLEHRRQLLTYNVLLERFFFDSKIEEAEDVEKVQGNMMGVGIGVVLILALIGILNYVNTMTGNIQSRQTELAILESVGMTEKQMRRMLMIEGLLFAGISLFLTATLGTAVTYYLYQSMNYRGVPFMIPVFPVFIMAVIVVVVSVAVPLIVERLIGRKKSVVERIRTVE